MIFQRTVIGLLILVIAGLAGAFYMNWKTLTQLRTMKAFVEDMKAQGNMGRVLVMTFSEFGRRVSEKRRTRTSSEASSGGRIVLLTISIAIDWSCMSRRPTATDARIAP